MSDKGGLHSTLYMHLNIVIDPTKGNGMGDGSLLSVTNIKCRVI